MIARPPLVTAIVPTFNGERFVRETLDSILAQTYGHVELLVCDDGSEDATLDILASYGSDLRVFSSPHLGVAHARNLAAAHASGDYLAFLDHDDVWEPRMLEVQVGALEEQPDVGLVYADSLVIDGEGRAHGRRAAFLQYASGHVYGDLIHGNFIPIETSVVRTPVFRALGGFREDLFYLEDYDFFLRVAREHSIGLHHGTLARYRIHEHNLSHNIEAILHEWTAILERLPHDGEARAARTIQRELGRRYGELAWHALRRLDLEGVDQSLARARSRCPLGLSLRVHAFRMLLGHLPPGLAERVVGLLPRRRLYGVETNGASVEAS